MRFVVKKDVKITKEQWDKLAAEFTALYQEHAGITPTFFVEEHTYGGIPTIIDSDGDVMPDMAWRTATMKAIHARYGDFGTDHVVCLIHRDNWQFTGIWGTNWSNIYHGYQVHLCRFDNKNSANSLGTLYHEVMHSHDALIKATINVDIHALIGFDFDKFAVHGGRPDKEFTTEWKYIRHKENTAALAYIAPYLKQSYEKRLSLHRHYTGLLQQVLTLAQQYLVLWRAKHNPKDGVPRT